MLDFLWNIITFIPWLITQSIVFIWSAVSSIITFIWSTTTSIIGFVFTILSFPFKVVFSVLASILFFFSPAPATATNSPSQVIQSSPQHQAVASYSEQQAEQILRAMRSLQSQGRSMNRSNLTSCGNEMRDKQSQVTRLVNRAKQLDNIEAKQYLTMAEANLKACVSCLPGASTNCNAVNLDLDDAQKSL